MKRYSNIFMPFVFVLLAVFLAKNLHAGLEVSKPCKEEVIQKSVVSGSGQIQDTSGIMQKIQTLRMPFIVNEGQVDEPVAFYAKTFSGTVFVTKDGEIVYSLPPGRDVPAGASPSPQAHGRKGTEDQGCRGAWVANGYSPFLRADNADCPPERVLTNALLAAYLPGLQKETTQRVVSTSTRPS